MCAVFLFFLSFFWLLFWNHWRKQTCFPAQHFDKETSTAWMLCNMLPGLSCTSCSTSVYTSQYVCLFTRVWQCWLMLSLQFTLIPVGSYSFSCVYAENHSIKTTNINLDLFPNFRPFFHLDHIALNSALGPEVFSFLPACYFKSLLYVFISVYLHDGITSVHRNWFGTTSHSGTTNCFWVFQLVLSWFQLRLLLLSRM